MPAGLIEALPLVLDGEALAKGLNKIPVTYSNPHAPLINTPRRASAELLFQAQKKIDKGQNRKAILDQLRTSTARAPAAQIAAPKPAAPVAAPPAAGASAPKPAPVPGTPPASGFGGAGFSGAVAGQIGHASNPGYQIASASPPAPPQLMKGLPSRLLRAIDSGAARAGAAVSELRWRKAIAPGMAPKAAQLGDMHRKVMSMNLELHNPPKTLHEEIKRKLGHLESQNGDKMPFYSPTGRTVLQPFHLSERAGERTPGKRYTAHRNDRDENGLVIPSHEDLLSSHAKHKSERFMEMSRRYARKTGRAGGRAALRGAVAGLAIGAGAAGLHRALTEAQHEQRVEAGKHSHDRR